MSSAADLLASGGAAAGRLGRRAVSTAGGVLNAAADRPLLIGGACLAAGFLLGFVLPATRREDDLLGASRDRLVARARATGEEVAQASRDAARQIVHDATETLRAAEADLVRSFGAERDLPPPPQLM